MISWSMGPNANGDQGSQLDSGNIWIFLGSVGRDFFKIYFYMGKSMKVIQNTLKIGGGGESPMSQDNLEYAPKK